MPSVHARLLEARQALLRAGITEPEAVVDAEVLARHVLGWDRATLVARWRDEAPGTFGPAFDPLLARRVAREPVAYIIGHREFWGLDFDVTPDVLIPRPETELIVEQALAFAREVRPPALIIDVGTGSGCLAVAVACELSPARVTATDISAPALEVARRNAKRHEVGGRVTLVEADLLTGVHEMADLIISNPPYVPPGDASGLQPEVGQFEPAAALFGGDEDGLGTIRRLLNAAPGSLAPGGRLVVEFGFGQDAPIRRAARDSGWQMVRVAADLQGIPRVAVLRR